MTTPNGHLTAAGELIAIGVMGGIVLVACAGYLAYDYLRSRVRRRAQ